MHSRNLLKGLTTLPLLAIPTSLVLVASRFTRSTPHYSRLRAIKSKYDAEGLFFVHHGVGSEDFSADGFTRIP
jgi:hypothetical protein